MQKLFFNVLLLLAIHIGYSQSTQTVRGQVTDKDSEFPLMGAIIQVVGIDPVLATTADIDGYFKIENVPVGRISLQITFLGFETITALLLLVFLG